MNARFAVGKLRNLDIAEGGVELFRDLPRQGKIGIARKQFDVVTMQIVQTQKVMSKSFRKF